VDQFESVIEIPDAKAILDVKIASFSSFKNIILAVTESSLYQFHGDNVIKDVLQQYSKNNQKMLKHQLTIEASISNVD
jgi:hypothetical protein